MRRDPCPSQRTGRATLGAALFAAVTALVAGSPVQAHTDIDYTQPADQEQAAEPVSQITVAFTDPVTLVGAGFEVFTPQEVIVQPGVSTVDNIVFVLQLDAPLTGGAAGVRYAVAAADGHLIEGGFSFTVPAAPATTPPTTPPAAPPASAPPTVPGTLPAPPATTAAGATTTSPAEPPDVTALIAPAPSAEPTTATTLATDDGGGGSTTGLIIGVVAALAVGAIAFVVLRSRGARPT